MIPELGGNPNQFVRKMSNSRNHNRPFWTCRVRVILDSIRCAARKRNYQPINPNTSHSVIRQLMQEKNCVLCGEPLDWELGRGTTPHLHHDHETGEIYGFAHPKCNPRAEAKEIFRLKSEVRKLQQEVQILREAA